MYLFYSDMEPGRNLQYPSKAYAIAVAGNRERRFPSARRTRHVDRTGVSNSAPQSNAPDRCASFRVVNRYLLLFNLYSPALPPPIP
jgi:hypothetical protein